MLMGYLDLPDVGDHFDVGVLLADLLHDYLRLGFVNVLLPEEELSVQIAHINGIKINLCMFNKAMDCYYRDLLESGH
jgi:hypothetical protein